MTIEPAPPAEQPVTNSFGTFVKLPSIHDTICFHRVVTVVMELDGGVLVSSV